MSAQPESIIVVGAGLSGWRTAKDLRKLGYAGDLVLLGDEDELPYDRPPLSKAVLTGDREPEAVRLTSEDEIAELGIDFRPGARVTSVRDGVVETAAGERLEAEIIVLATGSRANIPPFIADMPDVRPLRNMGDARRVKEDFGRISSVLILGGGFIGAEVAGSARKLGLDATVVEGAPNILGPLGPEIAAIVEQIHRDAGVTVITGAPVEIVDATANDGATVVLADGRKLTADIVVVGFGARLNTEAFAELATPNGVECDQRGRVVGHPGLYAVGDVAAWWDPKLERHVRREHWQTAGDGAAIVAHTILGLEPPEMYASAPPYFWTDQPGVKVQLLGWPALADREGWIEDTERDPHTVYGWWMGDKLVAVALLGQPRLMVRYRKELMELEV
ncbi:MAG: NAD(P)/FAD-dependent oxidoreductase [Aeromicrobium sp.]